MAAKSVNDGLYILLWNVHCNVCRVEEIDEPLTRVAIDASSDTYRNILLLCTDEVTQRKRQILDQRFPLAQGVTREVQTEHAEIYSKLQDNYSLNYVPIDGRTSPSIRDRISACVLTRGEKRILIVAWHGPNNVSRPEKIATLKKLLEFAERTRSESRYGAAIVGGDFNLESDSARSAMSDENLEGEVLDSYESERRIDYLLYWPKRYDDLRHSTSRRVHENETIFNHPIVLYNFPRCT